MFPLLILADVCSLGVATGLGMCIFAGGQFVHNIEISIPWFVFVTVTTTHFWVTILPIDNRSARLLTAVLGGCLLVGFSALIGMEYGQDVAAANHPNLAPLDALAGFYVGATMPILVSVGIWGVSQSVNEDAKGNGGESSKPSVDS